MNPSGSGEWTNDQFYYYLGTTRCRACISHSGCHNSNDIAVMTKLCAGRRPRPLAFRHTRACDGTKLNVDVLMAIAILLDCGDEISLRKVLFLT